MIQLRYKRLSIILFVAILVFGLIVPRSSWALLEIFTAPFVWMATMLTKLYFFIFVSQWLLRMANGILGWVTNANFIEGGFTQNALVKEGWQITRDLVNMFFILIMVGVGVATILRVQGYEIKKMIPKVIVVIILINFTPLICGLIIDAANILMNFFLAAGTRGTGSMINSLEAPQSSLGRHLHALWEAVRSFDFGDIAFAIFSAIVTLAFNLIAAFILITLALLFLMRYIMLWILVMLAPLAFFCLILPATKKIWDTWWHQFVQWCFIGIGGAFFLYLTQRMTDVIRTLILTPGAEQTQLQNGLSAMVLYLVPLIFLAAGYMATTSFAPMGASQIIGLTKKGARWTKGKAGKRVIQGLKKDTQKAAERFKKAAEPFKQKLGGWASKVGEEAPRKWKGAAPTQKAKIPYYWARQRVAKTVLTKTAEVEVKEIEKLIEKFKGLTEAGRTLQMRTAKTDTERAAAVLAKIEKQETKAITEEELAKAIRKASDIDKGLGLRTMAANPELAQEFWKAQMDEIHGLDLEERAALRAGNTTRARKLKEQAAAQEKQMERKGMQMKQEDYQQYGSFEGKLMATMKEKYIPNISEEYIKTDRAQKFIHDFWRGSQVSAAARAFERAFVNEFNKTTEDINVRIETITDPTHKDYVSDKLYEKYNRLNKYLRGTAAREFGFIEFTRRPEPPPTPLTPPSGPTIHTPPPRVGRVKFTGRGGGGPGPGPTPPPSPPGPTPPGRPGGKP